MFFRGKKTRDILLRLVHGYASIAQFQISYNPKPYLTPRKITLITNPKFLGFLGMVYSPLSTNVGFPAKKLCSPSAGRVEDEEGLKEISDFYGSEGHGKRKDVAFNKNAGNIMSILKQFGSLSPEARLALEKSGVVSTSRLVQEILFRSRNDWKSAFTCFLWAGSQPGYKHNLRTYHMMISILGKLKKFSIAWGLIKEMQGGENRRGMVNFQTLLVMMRSYSAVHDVARAIKTFYSLEEYKLKVNIRAFQGLLDVLCRHKNVGVAEQLLYDKKDVFGYRRRSFNIVLNGWCNMIVNVDEARRFWKVMADNGIRPDADSYNSMICCFSKSGRINVVVSLFDEMKRRNCTPDFNVYNSMIYSLARGNSVKEAHNLLNVMVEKGFTPNVETYNSLIIPLCRGQRLEDAHMIFDEMIQKGHPPSLRTFHAFFIALKDPKEIVKFYENMIKGDCSPTLETFIILVRKFCRLRDYENVFKLWNDMVERGLGPDRGAYIVLIHGLFLNGKPEEACKYYEEMKAKGFSRVTKVDEMINSWIVARESAAPQLLKLKEKKTQESLEEGKKKNTKDHALPHWKNDRKFSWR